LRLDDESVVVRRAEMTDLSKVETVARATWRVAYTGTRSATAGNIVTPIPNTIAIAITDAIQRFIDTPPKSPHAVVLRELPRQWSLTSLRRSVSR
jgi:hypothetical protein